MKQKLTIDTPSEIHSLRIYKDLSHMTIVWKEYDFSGEKRIKQTFELLT
jgi:hypothetical protein